MNDAISVVSQLHTDYTACKAAFQSSRSEAAAIAETVQSRLQNARERDAARRSELEAIAADPEYSLVRCTSICGNGKLMPAFGSSL